MQALQKCSILFLLIVINLFPISGQVTLQIGDISTPAYTSDIAVPVILTNPNEAVAGIQFDVLIAPAMVALFDVTTTGLPAGYTADFNLLTQDSARVILYNQTGIDSISAGADTIMFLHYDGIDVTSAVLELLISELYVSDSDANLMSSTGMNGSIQIGHVVGLSLTSDSADVNEVAILYVNMVNNGIVGGLQFDLIDTPDYLSVDSVWTSDRTVGFTVDTAGIDNGTRFVLYSGSNDNIPVGEGSVLNVRFLVHYNAYAGNIAVDFDQVVVSDDIGGIYWIASLDSGTVIVYPGYLEEPHNLVATSGLDSQVPLDWEAPIGPIPPESDFSVIIFTDDYPGETSWDLINSEGVTINGISPGDLDSTVNLYQWDMTLEAGTYTFTIYDTFGDGICCAYGEGYYSLILNGTEIATGAEFGASESVTFTTASGRIVIARTYYEDPLSFEKGSVISTSDLASVKMIDPIIVANKINVATATRPFTDVTREIARELEITGYNIYRTTDDNPDFQLLDAVGSDETSYIDFAVLNGTTYHYYITTVYETGGESNPSNQVTATPVEWVELSVSDGAALSGQTDTIEVYLNNESDITQIQFTITYNPDVIQTLEALPTERTDNFQVLNLLENQIIFFNGILAPGDGAITRLVVRPESDEEVAVAVGFSSAFLLDAYDNEMQWTAEPSSFNVTIETQSLFLTNALGSPGGLVTLSLMMNNTQNVHGVQVFIVDAPDYLTGMAVNPTNHIDFSNWTVDGNAIGNEYRILLYDNSLSNPIPPGSGHILDIAFLVSSNAPMETAIATEMTNIVVSDINNISMHVEPHNGQVYIGTPQVMFAIENVSGSSPGNHGTYTISLQNLLPVYVFELFIMDMPNNLTLMNITPEPRFDAGTIDGNSGEMEDGMGYILGYDLANGIQPGGGPILAVEVAADASMDQGEIMLMLMDATSADANMSYIPTMTSGFGMYSVTLGAVEREVIPDEFALYQNYPNPFNPVTAIQYDLKTDAIVNLVIYDLMGHEVKTLVNLVQTAGRKTVLWNGTDDLNQPIAAGVYLYRLKADNFTDTQKMLFIK